MTFEIYDLSLEEQETLINRNGWNELSPVPLSRLRILKLFYLDFNNVLKSGKLICMDIVSESIIKIFKELLEAGFPINSIELLDKYKYNDFESMSSNNTSCYNSRLIPGTDRLSIHSYGLAIDINPEQNPMISFGQEQRDYQEAMIYPTKGRFFANRMLLKPGMVEPVVDIFMRNGFDVWGGLWQSFLDYHHFEVNRSLAEKLAAISKEEGYELWLDHLQKCK